MRDPVWSEIHAARVRREVKALRTGTGPLLDVEERTLDVLLGDGKLARRSGGFDQGAACALERV
jgi:hypothetical protein